MTGTETRSTSYRQDSQPREVRPTGEVAGDDGGSLTTPATTNACLPATRVPLSFLRTVRQKDFTAGQVQRGELRPRVEEEEAR